MHVQEQADLIALGYKQVDAHKAVHDLQQKGEGKSAEELVKLTLKRIAAGR
jgi:Holliday junction resolvasome RuvABC DNA-binding subunit